MGRLAIADEQLWTNCKQYQPSKGYVVGLILGQPSKAADYIVHLARLPPPDNIINDKDPSTKAPVQGHLLTEIKDAWVTSHASDVTRMLPGGMWVLGLFLIGESDPFDNQPSCTRLRNVLRHMQGELKKNPSLHGDSPSEKLLLYLNVQRNILVCKSVDLEGSAAFRPAEWKFQKNPIAWTQIDSILDLNFATYLNKEDTIKQLKSQLNDVLSAVSKQVSESICTLSNELLDEDDLVDSIFQKKSKGSKKGKGGCQDQPKKLTANLYEPMVGEVGLKRTTDLELSESHGVMYFVGSPTSRVFINQKSTFAEACRAVKQDITRSIATRLQMHVDSLVEEEPNPREDLETFHEPPHRVMIKLPSTNVTFSDYLFPGEGPEEALLSSEDLLDLSLQLEDIETDIEVPADYGTRQQQQDIEQIEDSKAVALAASSEKSSYIVLVTLGALFCVLLGFLIQSFVL